MDKKYFFFDIDGTLTDNRTHKIVPSAERTLHELEKNGHFVAIATGRAHYKAISFTNAIDIHNLVCYGGGCLVVNDEVLDMTPLDAKALIPFLKHADEDGVGYLLAFDDSPDAYMKDYRFLEQAGRRREITSYKYDPSIDLDSLKDVYKVHLAIPLGKEDQYPWLNDMGHLRMNEEYFVIQYDQKKDGILRMMKLLNADPSDVVVFGDDMNDLVMFDPQWFRIAMGNGKDALKEKADYVTDTNINDGIEKACKHFGWIQ